MGQIVKMVEERGLARQTLIMFFSDNGPFLSYGEHAGHAEPLREGKLTTFEGGFRSPCIMRWPGQIPAGTGMLQRVSSMDLLPTIARLVDFTLPQDRTIDRRDTRPLVRGVPHAKSRMSSLFLCRHGTAGRSQWRVQAAFSASLSDNCG